MVGKETKKCVFYYYHDFFSCHFNHSYVIKFVSCVGTHSYEFTSFVVVF